MTNGISPFSLDRSTEIRLRTDADRQNRYTRGQNVRRSRQLDDPEAYRDRARQASASAQMLQKKVDKHDLDSVENARQLIQYIGEEPDQTYYQFHDGRSTVVFERDCTFLFATEDQVKFLFEPAGDGYEKYKEQQVSSFIKMD